MSYLPRFFRIKFSFKRVAYFEGFAAAWKERTTLENLRSSIDIHPLFAMSSLIPKHVTTRGASRTWPDCREVFSTRRNVKWSAFHLISQLGMSVDLRSFKMLFLVSEKGFITSYEKNRNSRFSLNVNFCSSLHICFKITFIINKQMTKTEQR